MLIRLLASSIAVAACIAAPVLAKDRDVPVKGGGSTFAAPLYKAWIDAYRSIAPAVDISYEVIGSGEGIARFLDGSLDFGASDAPLTTEQEAAVPGGVSHVPVTAGMVAVPYNLPGDLKGPLRLPRDVLGEIFAGVVTSWDDPRLVSANPDLHLPHDTIRVVARLDGSGTTYAFTNHLNATSEAWRSTGVGVGTQVGWPAGAMRARGNEGVAVNIQRADGTIGYVEYGFASRLGLPLAVLENAAGDFVVPSPESGAAAIAEASLPPDLKIDIPDPAGAGAYPIVTFTWELVRNQPEDSVTAEALRAFTGWAVSEGQELAAPLGYVPLPASVRERIGPAVAPAL
jgi:phosphate transport system substrate-binding protein